MAVADGERESTDCGAELLLVHKLANVLGCLPASVHAGARTALAEIRDAPDRDHAQRAIQRFARDDGVTCPGRWPRSPTTPRNCSASSTSRLSIGWTSRPATHRVDLLHGAVPNPGDQGARLHGREPGDGVQAAGAAQDRWGAVNGPHLVALVRAGARFDNGVMIERPDEDGEVAA